MRARGRARAGASGCAPARSQARNVASQRAAGEQRRDHLGAAPADGCSRARDPRSAASGAGARQHEPGDVECGRGPKLSLRRRRASGTSDQPDRHVQPEDPVPVDPAHDRPAGGRAERPPGRRPPQSPTRRRDLGREGLADRRHVKRRDQHPSPGTGRLSANTIGASAIAAEPAEKTIDVPSGDQAPPSAAVAEGARRSKSRHAKDRL